MKNLREVAWEDERAFMENKVLYFVSYLVNSYYSL